MNFKQIASDPMLLNTERHNEFVKNDLFLKLNKNNDFRKTWFKSKESTHRLDKKSSYLNSDPVISKEYNDNQNRKYNTKNN